MTAHLNIALKNPRNIIVSRDTADIAGTFKNKNIVNLTNVKELKGRFAGQLSQT